MKKYLSILLVLLLVMMQIPSIGVASNPVSVYEPVLSIESSDIPEVNAGTKTSITFTLKNESGNARDIMATPSFEKDGPFTPNNITQTFSIPNISGGSKQTVKLDLLVSPTAAEGIYPIPVNFKYNYIIYDTDDSSKHTIYPGSYSETIYVRVTDKLSPARLVVNKLITTPSTILPNQDIKLSVLFQNKGSLLVKNVSAKIEGLNHDSGFYITSGSDTAIVKSVNANATSYVDYYLKSSNNIKKGSHELSIKFSYNGIEETQKIYLNVGGDSSQGSNLVLENLTYPSNAIGPNKDFKISFDLRNNGGVNANNILVRLDSSDPAIIPKTTSIKNVNSIVANGSEKLEFVFSPTSDVSTKNYPIKITVDYEDELTNAGEKRSTINQYVGVYVEAPGESSGKSKPKLIIDKYSFNPSLVKAGENFDMNLSFYNTNGEKSIKNIKIFLTASSGSDPGSSSAGSSVFTPVDSSNTFYIESIPPKGRVEKTITMFTIPDALAKTHTVTAHFEYEDNEGNEYPAQELIGVPVVQQSKLETGELGYWPDAMLGEPVPISLEFYNTGKVTLYNMMVKLEGDFQTEHGQYFVGNFQSGSSDYFEGMVVPHMDGELTGEVVFTYEDSTGQTQELREEFTLNIMDRPPMDEYPGEFPPMEDPNQGGIKGILKSKWLWISIGAIVVLVAGIIIYRKKKKKKDFAFDE